jgi:DNA-binding transcriptional regulator GbsR (MarR family)
MKNQLSESQEKFIVQWGALGTAWGINRTMAQINALLLISPKPLTTDDVMERLSISRGNAHSNLKELVHWGICHTLIKPGDRKEYFESEKDPWKLFVTVIKERQRREIDPIIRILEECKDETKDLAGEDAEEFTRQVDELKDFAELIVKLIELTGKAEKNFLIKSILKMLK